MKEKKTAIVEFCDASAVEEVLKKKPVMFGTTELDVKPFKPLLSGDASITQADVKGTIKLPKEFTKHLLKKYSEYCESPPQPSYGPELAAKMTHGTRVVRGRDWRDGDRDGGGKGTVDTQRAFLPVVQGMVHVKWDNENIGYYKIGKDDCYELKLAP